MESKYDDWLSIELAEAMVESIDDYDGRDPQEISEQWDRSDMIDELINAHGHGWG